MRAELIEDGGLASAEAGQFFRSPGYLAAEGTTHTLAIDSEPPLRAPLVVQPIEGTDRRDGVSPYGFPGAGFPGAAETPDPPPNPAQVDWSATGLVSVFVRDRIGAPSLADGTIRSQVHLADPRGEGGIRKRLREQIRANERRGWRVGAEPGSDADPADRLAFSTAYTETMRRTGAAARYFFDDDYFEGILSEPSAWLLLAGREGRAPEAGAIAVTCDGYLHYFLGGTADSGLQDSPMKNLFAAMIALAGELGIVLNLGGGVTPGDSLDSFKRGFANGSADFRTHELICDRAAYDELSAGTEAPEAFFPAYRARP